MLVLKCKNCGVMFRTNRKRKTCSSKCADKIREKHGSKQSRAPKKKDPTPEEIAHKTALIRAGILVIKSNGEDSDDCSASR